MHQHKKCHKKTETEKPTFNLNKVINVEMSKSYTSSVRRTSVSHRLCKILHVFLPCFYFKHLIKSWLRDKYKNSTKTKYYWPQKMVDSGTHFNAIVHSLQQCFVFFTKQLCIDDYIQTRAVYWAFVFYQYPVKSVWVTVSQAQTVKSSKFCTVHYILLDKTTLFENFGSMPHILSRSYFSLHSHCHCHSHFGHQS